MTDILSNVFLGCFLFGFLFTTLSLLLGMDHHGGHGGGGHQGFDAGHGAAHGGHAGHDLGGHAGHGHGGHHGVDAHGSHCDGAGHAQDAAEIAHGGAKSFGARGPLAPSRVPFFNFNSLLMFVTFFGGVGFALTQGRPDAVLLPLAGGMAAGLVGASAVVVFMNKVLLKAETPMNPADYYMPGTLARVTSRVRGGGGTGELVYAQAGARKTLGARAEDGETEFAQGAEVVIIRAEAGIAYVRLAEDYLRLGGIATQEASQASIP